MRIIARLSNSINREGYKFMKHLDLDLKEARQSRDPPVLQSNEKEKPDGVAQRCFKYEAHQQDFQLTIYSNKKPRVEFQECFGLPSQRETGNRQREGN